MNNIDTTAVRALADAATPGPWTYDSGAVTLDADETLLVDVFGERWNEDARFIAHFDPPTVRAWADEIDTLRQRVQAVETLADLWRDKGDGRGDVTLHSAARQLDAALGGDAR